MIAPGQTRPKWDSEEFEQQGPSSSSLISTNRHKLTQRVCSVNERLQLISRFLDRADLGQATELRFGNRDGVDAQVFP